MGSTMGHHHGRCACLCVRTVWCADNRIVSKPTCITEWPPKLQPRTAAAAAAAGKSGHLAATRGTRLTATVASRTWDEHASPFRLPALNAPRFSSAVAGAMAIDSDDADAMDDGITYPGFPDTGARTGRRSMESPPEMNSSFPASSVKC